jgi:hypothetical protein
MMDARKQFGGTSCEFHDRTEMRRGNIERKGGGDSLLASCVNYIIC